MHRAGASRFPSKGPMNWCRMMRWCARLANSPNPLIPQTTPGLTVGKKGNIEASEDTGKTSKARVWAGGDVVSGAATVISRWVPVAKRRGQFTSTCAPSILPKREHTRDRPANADNGPDRCRSGPFFLRRLPVLLHPGPEFIDECEKTRSEFSSRPAIQFDWAFLIFC